MNQPISLPERFDGAPVEAFAGALGDRRGNPLVVDAGAVVFAGALGLQALVAARRQWQADGAAFGVEGMSDALKDICHLLGIDPREFGASVDADRARAQ